MEWQAWLTAAVVVAVLGALGRELYPPDIVLLSSLVLLWSVGILDTDMALAGFSNSGMITIGALFVTVGALSKADLVSRGAFRILGSSSKPRAALFRLQMLVSILSGFLNNTPLVALLVPIVRDWARNHEFAPSKFLIPLSFASISGGLCTIVGTSTNLVVQGLLAEQGFPAMGFFEISKIGVLLVGVSILYMQVIGFSLLPGDRGGLFRFAREKGSAFLTELRVDDRFDQHNDVNSIIVKATLPNDCVVGLLRPKGQGDNDGEETVSRSIRDQEQSPVNGNGRERRDSLFQTMISKAFRRPSQTKDCRETQPSTVIGEADPSALPSSAALSEFSETDADTDGLAAAGIQDTYESELEGHIGTVHISNGAPINSEIGVLQSQPQEDKGNSPASLQEEAGFKSSDDQTVHSGAVVINLSRQHSSDGDFADNERASIDMQRLGTTNLQQRRRQHRTLAANHSSDSEPQEHHSASVRHRNRRDSRTSASRGASIGQWMRIFPVSGKMRLKPGDRLVMSIDAESVGSVASIKGLKVATPTIGELQDIEDAELLEFVISNTNPCLGMKVHDPRFRSRYDCQVLAARQRGGEGESVSRSLRKIRIKYGDTLLVLAKGDSFAKWRQSSDFFLVTRVGQLPQQGTWTAYIPLGIFAAMLTAVTVGWADMPLASMVAAILCVLGGFMTGQEARESIDWQLLITIGSAFGLSRAIRNSGLGPAIASVLASASGSAWVSLSLVFLVTMVMTEAVTNNAAAALTFPVAMQVAKDLDVNHLPFAVAIMVAASTSFATPVGYATNLIVYGPGGYKYTDYVRVGLPLDCLVAAISCLFIPIIWPF